MLKWIPWLWVVPPALLGASALLGAKSLDVAGAVFQVAGMAGLLWEGKRLRDWWLRHPGRAQTVVADAAEVVVEAFDARASSVPPDLEGRVKELERESGVLHSRIDEETQARKDADERERRARTAGDGAIRTEADEKASREMRRALACGWWVLAGFLAQEVAKRLG